MYHLEIKMGYICPAMIKTLYFSIPVKDRLLEETLQQIVYFWGCNRSRCVSRSFPEPQNQQF